MNSFDELLGIASLFDWITPLHTFALDAYYKLFHGGGYTFLVPRNCGRSGGEVVTLLRHRSITTWGHMIVNDCILFTVPKTDARYAQRILDAAGVPIENPVCSYPVVSHVAPVVPVHASRPPLPQATLHQAANRLFDLLGRL